MIINGKRFTGLQAFKEKNKQDYLIADLNSFKYHPQHHLESICTTIDGNPTSLATSCVSLEFLEKECTCVTWKKIPKVWQDQFLNKLEYPEKVIKQSSIKKSKPEQLKLF